MEIFYNRFFKKYESRIKYLKDLANFEIEKYINNEIPLHVVRGEKLVYITINNIKSDINKAYINGLSSVEYKVHKYYYPGYKFDNISFLTGKYYIYSNDIKQHVGISGAPSYINELKKKIPGFSITFVECENNNGILSISLNSPL